MKFVCCLGKHEEDSLMIVKRKAENTPAADILFPSTEGEDGLPQSKKARFDEEMDNRIAMFVASSTSPCNIVENDNFVRMLKHANKEVSIKLRLLCDETGLLYLGKGPK